MIIEVKISSVVESGLGHWLYTHFVTFPHNPNYAYDIRASLEGFMHTTNIWRKAGYDIKFLNEYPKA